MACFAESEPKRPKFDKSMIGNPSGFKHTSHFGAADADGSALEALGGKGGYSSGGLTAEERAMLEEDMDMIDLSAEKKDEGKAAETTKAEDTNSLTETAREAATEESTEVVTEPEETKSEEAPAAEEEVANSDS